MYNASARLSRVAFAGAMALAIALTLGFSAPALAQSSLTAFELDSVGWMLRLIFGDRLTSEIKNRTDVFSARDLPGAQERIDRVIEGIFHTPTGDFLCTEVLQGDAKLIEHHIGVSPGVAAKIAAGCRDRVKPSEHSALVNSRELRTPRKFFFVIHHAPDARFDSWTNISNHTFLMGREFSEISDSLLRDMLAHELAVYFDQKAALYEKNPNVLASLGIPEPNPRCAAIASVSNPVIRFAFATLRAFEIERIIRGEAASDSRQRTSRNSTCMARVRALVDELMPAGPQLASFGIRMDFCGTKSGADSLMTFGPMKRFSADEVRLEVESDLDALKAAMDRAGDTDEAFCQFMLEPRLSGRMIHFSQGPRPRIKGW